MLLAWVIPILTCLCGCSPGDVPTPSDNQTPPAPKVDPTAPKADFDGAQAFAMLKKQVAFGPRVPGSDAHKACRDWLVTTLKTRTEHVQTQRFTGSCKGKTVEMFNVIARFNPEAKRQVVVCAHWDTRPTADEDLDWDRRDEPILGANDGASGAAVLLELARVFAKRPPEVGVALIFLDGEDVGPELDNMLLGAKHWSANQIPKGAEFGILLDMIGDKDLRVPVEGYSLEVARPVVDKVYKMAERLGLSETFPYEQGQLITDDHVPMNQGGVPTIDLIDFTYPHWHTHKDTADKCGAESLSKVGRLVEAVLREEKATTSDQ